MSIDAIYADVMRVVPGLAEHRIAAGTQLIREGAPGREAYLIVDGSFDVVLRGQCIATLEPGEFVGEMALLVHGPRSATVVAATDATVLVCDAASFAQLVQRPMFLRRIASALTERLRRAERAPSYG